ncbi:MAG: hypothetical protein M3460_12500 [Actinomycetota bacterium]|nr:hypothetical protein [Actinomycetota bacterium]
MTGPLKRGLWRWKSQQPGREVPAQVLENPCLPFRVDRRPAGVAGVEPHDNVGRGPADGDPEQRVPLPASKPLHVHVLQDRAVRDHRRHVTPDAVFDLDEV